MVKKKKKDLKLEEKIQFRINHDLKKEFRMWLIKHGYNEQEYFLKVIKEQLKEDD